MRRCGGRRPRGLGGHARGRNRRRRRCLGGRTAAGWRGRAVLRGTLDEAGRLGAGREGRGAVGCVGWRLPGDAVPTGWASRPLGEACPRRGDPDTGPRALFVRSTRLGTGLSFTGSSLCAGPPTTDPRPRTRLPTAPRLRAERSLAGRFLEGLPSALRAVPDRARRRGEAVVQGVRGRCGARVVGGVVQLPPPVVLVTATGGCSPLLAHAPNCPPHRPYENGASRKSSPAPRIELCGERVAGRFHPPRENRPATPSDPDSDLYGGRTSWGSVGSALSVTCFPVAEL
ncbi:hypothetical protein SCANM124S_02601 [Streptomyces canus]